MKVFVVTSSFPTWGGPRSPEFVADLIRGLSGRGISSIVVAPHFPGGVVEETRDGIHIYRFKYFYPEYFERLAYGAGMLVNMRQDFFAFTGIVPFFLAEFFKTVQVLRREKPDIIHTHWLLPQGLVGAVIRCFTETPHIVTVHGSDIALIKKSRSLLWICSFVVRNADIVTVNSRYTRQELLNAFPDSDQKIRVIPMGVDPEAFRTPSQAPVSLKIPKGRIILSVGRLIKIKGTRYLIDAMPAVIRACPDAVLVIVGTGPEQEMLERRVKELSLGNNVHFLGDIPHEQISHYYHAADVFILPSITLDGVSEALGVVLLEAMASGCPVIGSNVGGIPDIINDGENGFLVPEQNSNGLAERIITLLSEKSLQEKFRRNGLFRVRDIFSWDIVATNFSKLFREVWEKNSGTR